MFTQDQGNTSLSIVVMEEEVVAAPMAVMARVVWG